MSSNEALSRAPSGHFPARLTLGGLLASGVLAGVACGGSTDEEVGMRYSLANQLAQATSYGGEPAAAAGAAGAPGLGGTGGTPGAGGTASGGSAGAPTMPDTAPADGSSGPPQECTGRDIDQGIFGTPAPADGLLVDFATYTGGGEWGDDVRNQVTGGTSVYSGTPGSALGITVENGELHLTATIAAASDYTGIVLWFGPCVNASAFGGLTFPIRGSLGGSTLLIKTQTSPNYPVDVANRKGKCTYAAGEDRFTVCQQPTATLTELTENPMTLTWDEFTGGVPQANVDPAQLLGFELQFQCQAEGGGCEVDLWLGTVHFVTPG